ncbi:MAG: hypothetical protein CMN29_17975 [Sandaracinus sp.]|nr:hypothetical protein [Sandaracinus sp.]
MEPRVEWDESRWPVVRCRIEGEHHRDMAGEGLDPLARLLQGRRPFALLWDLRELSPPGPWAVRALGELRRRHARALGTILRAEAHVVSNRALLGMVAMISWFQRAPMPERSFLDPAAAERWLTARIDADATLASIAHGAAESWT